LNRLRLSIIIIIIIQTIFADQQLSLVTYNIHALHPIISRDNPHQRIPEILNKSDGYDILFLQENWIFKDKELLAHLPNYNIVSSRASKFLWPIKKIINPHGSGLVLFVKKEIDIISQNEESFEKCSGWISKEHDCLSPKGFQHIILKIDSDSLHLYNTHLDAGTSQFDQKVRKLQIEHLANYIIQNSTGHPLIIAGDFNVNLLKDENPIIFWFKHELELTIIDWMSSDNSKSSEILDYIFFRGSESLEMSLLKGEVDNNLNGLSDHPPIKAIFNFRSK